MLLHKQSDTVIGMARAAPVLHSLKCFELRGKPQICCVYHRCEIAL